MKRCLRDDLRDDLRDEFSIPYLDAVIVSSKTFEQHVDSYPTSYTATSG